MLYVLRDKEIVKVDNVIDWSIEFSTSNNIIARTEIGDVLVSTAFLGLNYSISLDNQNYLKREFLLI